MRGAYSCSSRSIPQSNQRRSIPIDPRGSRLTSGLRDGRTRPVLVVGFLAALVVVTTAEIALPEGCYFSDLQWSSEGDALFFLAGPPSDVRTLRYELRTGRIDCIDPQVREASWAGSSASVLFRDLFGVFEIRVEPGSSLLQPRMLVLLPEASRHFLRAFGEDSRGQPLLWTYDRDAETHSLYTLAPEGALRLPGEFDGMQALRTWQERNRGVDFADAGGRYVRSTCVARPWRSDQLCLENIARSRQLVSPIFRMTMGAPGGIQVLQNRCAPSGIAPSPDSTQVVVGIFEEVDDAGMSDVLSCWLMDWHDGVRLQETLLPEPVYVGQRHQTWIHWLNRSQALWADVAGQLFLIDIQSRSASTMIPLAPRPVRSALHRVVVVESSNREEALQTTQELREAGLDAGAFERAGRYEVQLGAWVDRNDALERVDYLRQRGYRSARVLEGDVADIAMHMGFGWVPGPNGQGAFIRNVRGRRGIFSEIWLIRSGATAERIVGSFEEVGVEFSGRY